MLIVKGTQAAPAGKLQLNSLVVTVTWPTSLTESPRYWRTGDFRQSLLEIGVHPHTGRLLSITLVNIPRLGTLEPEEMAYDEAATLITDQIPLFDLAAWSEGSPFVDEPNNLRARIGYNRLTIDWGDTPSGNYAIQSGRCFMGIGDHYALIGLHLNPLSDAEITAIQNMFSD